jgi:hypothetical protein
MVLAALPASVQQPLAPGAASVAIGSGSFRASPATQVSSEELDVTVVLDTAAAVPKAAFAGARAVVRGLVSALPAGTDVTLVTAGGSPQRVLTDGRSSDRMMAAVASVERSPGHALYDAITLAADSLPHAPQRARSMIVVAGGPDDVSGRNLGDAAAAIVGSGVLVSLVDVGRHQSLPSLDTGCTVRASSSNGFATGRALAGRATSAVWLPADGVTSAGSVRVRVSSGGELVSGRTLTTGTPERAGRGRPANFTAGRVAAESGVGEGVGIAVAGLSLALVLLVVAAVARSVRRRLGETPSSRSIPMPLPLSRYASRRPKQAAPVDLMRSLPRIPAAGRPRRTVAALPFGHRRSVCDDDVAAADRLLRSLAAGDGSPMVWTLFESETGLEIPPATRAVLDPDMDAAALVGHLAARRRPK